MNHTLPAGKEGSRTARSCVAVRRRATSRRPACKPGATSGQASGSRVWPGADRALKVGVVATFLYFVEAVMHTAAAVDSEALAHGHSAPVAFTHLGLAAILYPVSRAAIVWMATTMGAEWGRLRSLSLLGIVGGCVHAVSVPATLLVADIGTP